VITEQHIIDQTANFKSRRVFKGAFKKTDPKVPPVKGPISNSYATTNNHTQKPQVTKIHNRNTLPTFFQAVPQL